MFNSFISNYGIGNRHGISDNIYEHFMNILWRF